MRIIFMRHGEAYHGSPDEKRELTPSGIEISNRNAKIASLYTNIDFIIASPLVRANQTADILHKHFANAKKLTDSSLAPGSDLESILVYCNSLEADTVALVGHQPDIANHVSDLISNTYSNIAVSPGTLASIVFMGSADIGRGFIEFMLQGK